MSRNAQDARTFALRLRDAREAMSLSQSEFGRLGGVGKMSQYQYEQGQRYPTVDYLLSLKGAGIDIIELLLGVPLSQALERRALEANKEVLLRACSAVNAILEAIGGPLNSGAREAATRQAIEILLASEGRPSPQQMRARMILFLEKLP